MSKSKEKPLPYLEYPIAEVTPAVFSYLDFLGENTVRLVTIATCVLGAIASGRNPSKLASWCTKNEIETVQTLMMCNGKITVENGVPRLAEGLGPIGLKSPNVERMKRMKARKTAAAEGLQAESSAESGTGSKASAPSNRYAENEEKTSDAPSTGYVDNSMETDGNPSGNPRYLTIDKKDSDNGVVIDKPNCPEKTPYKTYGESETQAPYTSYDVAENGENEEVKGPYIGYGDSGAERQKDEGGDERHLLISEEDRDQKASDMSSSEGYAEGGAIEGGTKVIRKIPPYNPPLKNASDDDSYQQLSHTEDICYQEDLTNTEGDYDMREETAPYSKAVVPRVNAQNGNEEISDNPSADDNDGDNGKERSSHSLATAGDEKAISPESAQHTDESTPVQLSRTQDEAIAESFCTEKSTPAEAEPAGRKRPDTESDDSSSVLRQLSCPDSGASGNPEVRERKKVRKGERYPEPLSEGYLPGFEPVIGNPQKESLLPPDKPEKGKRKRKGRREPLTEDESAFVNAWKKVYNELCWNLPRAIGNTTTREVYENLVARSEENSGDGCDAEAVIREVFRRANQSYLMRGVKTSYRASFGKLLDKRIFYNTCNGNYNDPGEEEHVHDSNEEVKAMLQREAAAREAKKGRYSGNAGNGGNNGTRFKSADEVMQECYGHLQDSDGTEEAASGSSGMTLAAYMEWKRNGFKGAAN